MKKNYINKYLNKFTSLIIEEDEISKKIIHASKILKKTYKKNKIFIFGNGGSASIASHFTVDLIKNTNLKCVNFSDTALLTCFSNDFGYANWISKVLKIYAKSSDVVILISSSGNSKNMINAANYTKKNNLNLITLTGFEKSNKLNKRGKVNFWIDSKNYNHIENIHQILLLTICDYIANKSF